MKKAHEESFELESRTPLRSPQRPDIVGPSKGAAMISDRENLTAYLVRVIAQAGHTQTAMSEACSVSLSTASGWANGRAVSSAHAGRLVASAGDLLNHRLAAIAAALNGFGADGADLVEVRGQLARALLPGLQALVGAADRAFSEDRELQKSREALAARAGEFVSGLTGAIGSTNVGR